MRNNLRRFEVENFKCFRDRTIFEFSDLNLLYGKNSAGKSSLFDAIEYYAMLIGNKADYPHEKSTLERRFPFKRVVSDRDPSRTIQLVADFDASSSLFDKRLIEGVETPEVLKAMEEIGDLPASFLASLRSFREFHELYCVDTRAGIPKKMSHLAICSPLVLAEHIRTVGISFRIVWSERDSAAIVDAYGIRINGETLMSVGTIDPEAAKWDLGDDSPAAATQINPTHPCLPVSLVNIDRFGRILNILGVRGEERFQRFQKSRKLLDELDMSITDQVGTKDTSLGTSDPLDEADELPARNDHHTRPDESTFNGRFWESGCVWLSELEDQEFEYAKLKSITSELPTLPGQDDFVEINGLRWQPPLPSELQTDEQFREALACERQRLQAAQKPAPWIRSALAHQPGGAVPCDRGQARLSNLESDLRNTVDDMYSFFDAKSATYDTDPNDFESSETAYADGRGPKGCTEDEKHWNALIYHCCVLGCFAREIVGESLRFRGRVPPIRPRDLGSSIASGEIGLVNYWLCHDDGFRLGVRIRLAADLFHEELRNSGGDIPAEEAHSLAKKLFDWFRHFGQVDEIVWVNEENLLVRADEVGTGVSQLIPVVVSAFGSGIKLFEQPELHLHAEPQLVLGDMFLNAAVTHSRCQAFLETHSLPLLLRIMRRIREQSKRLAEGASEGEEDANLDAEVTESESKKLLADAIRVWHIRDHEGSSRAEEIRIDNEGMLIDEWPDDLFDVKFREVFGR